MMAGCQPPLAACISIQWKTYPMLMPPVGSANQKPTAPRGRCRAGKIRCAPPSRLTENFGLPDRAFFVPFPENRMHVSPAVPVRVFALLVVLLFGSTAHPVAQERIASLPQGKQVRITSDLLPSRTVIIFQGFRADTLLAIRRSGEPVSLPLSRIDQLEIARKDRLTGAIVGAGVGAMALTLSLAIYGHSQGGWLDCSGCPFIDDLGFAAIFGVPIGGVLGAITGGVVGIKRWDPLPRVNGRP